MIEKTVLDAFAVMILGGTLIEAARSGSIALAAVGIVLGVLVLTYSTAAMGDK